MFAMYLLHIKLNQINQNIFIFNALITAQPEFNIISGRLGELLAEPWWRVELAAAASCTTAMAIPERIIRIYSVFISRLGSRITKVILTNKWWNSHWE